MEFVKSNKNKDLLLCSGFLHCADRKQNNTIYWRCVKSSCKGRIIMINRDIKCQPKENSHSHVPDPCKIQCKMAVNNIKEAAVHTQNTPHDIISTVQIVPGVAGAMPSVYYLKHTIRGVRTQIKPSLNPTSVIMDFEYASINALKTYNAEEQPQKKKYKDYNKRIHALVTNYNTNENKNLIKGIAYNLSLNA
ncbi:hypothetical protein QTP88_014152 [Uroleucon formosanum]